MGDVRDLFGTELPLVQAPMAGVQTSPLAIAVSTAGGLGSLPCAMLPADAVRDELTAILEADAGPYNVNFFCHEQRVPDEQAERAWRETLGPYFGELGIDPSTVSSGMGRAPFDEAAVEIVEEFRPPVVSFHFGLPDETLLARVRATGAAILSSATTVDEAVWLAARGVDAVIAQGLEAGGHRGMFLTDDLSTQLGTFALVRQVVDAVSVPVIAAGAIADADGAAAAMALGASGVQIGTAYLLCDETATPQLHRDALTSDAARVTALTNVFTGRPARGIVNRLIRELGPISTVAPAFPFATAAVMALRAGAEAQGRTDFTPLWSGQNAKGCKQVPAGVLTRELAAKIT